MTYGVARAATSPELALYRTPGKASKWRAAIYQPHVIYTARINQSFSTFDSILELTYDAGSGSLPGVLSDMTLLVGSSAGAHDVGIVRIRAADATKFYIGETSDVAFADNQYLTVIDDFGLWARHVLISSGVSYMDGGVAYSNQHALPDPTPIMGSNRVLKLTGASVSAAFDFSVSYVIDGTAITGYSCSAPGSSSSSGMTTATPTISWNSVGWKKVYLTVTGANGKSFFAVRNIFIWNDDNLPPRVQIGTPRQDAETGGWEFELTVLDECDVDTIRDHALVILINEDYFGGTQSNIGPVAGAENIELEGWIARETISWNPEKGLVQFTAYTAHYWFGQIPAFPDGVEFTTTTPSAWTQFQDLTVAKGLWHFLHWRTTATRVMDLFLPDDTKYTTEVSSLASNLWEQIREMAFLQIYARAGVNAWNQLFIEVHPQLVPLASRTWATVLTITKQDWRAEINFERVTKTECAVVSLSGVAVNSSGVGASYFALSPGHAYPHYGAIDVQDRLLVSGQSQANQLAGLYRGWRNNAFPEIPIALAADIRLIDCFPRAKCAIVIDAADTPRGIAFSGNLLPTAVSIVTDPETGHVHREVSFEAETFEDISTNGDVPGGRADVSIPPTPSFPPLPDFPVILPGTITPSPNGPTAALIHDATYGMLYTADFDAASPTWITVNAGLTTAQYQAINNFFVCPNGAFYVALCLVVDSSNYLSRPFFIARAPSIGGTFTVLFDEPSIRPAVIALQQWGLFSAAHNPLASEEVGFVMGQVGVNKKFWHGAGSSFSAGAVVDSGSFFQSGLTYGFGYWLHTRINHFSKIAPGGGSVVTTGSPGIDGLVTVGQFLGHVRASTTGRTFHQKAGGGGYVVGDNNLGTVTPYTDSAFNGQGFASDAAGLYLMTTYGVGARGRSSDGGVTWLTIPSLPFGSWWFANGGDSNRWAAAGGSSVRYSPDFGVTWLNKEGSLIASPTPTQINGIKIVGY